MGAEDFQIAGRPARVLAVDDDSDLRFLFTLTFERLGFEVFTATTEAEAIAAVGERDPDIVVLDLGLGAGQGRTVLDVLKANPATSWIPVIIVSGSTLPDDVAQLLRCGAEDFIAKPWQIDDLTERVSAALQIAVAHRAGQ